MKPKVMSSSLEKMTIMAGVFGILCDVFVVMFFDVPAGVGFGIMGIGFAIAAKGDSRIFSKKAKTGLVLSIIALAIGVLIFLALLYSFKIMTDPKMSKMVMEEMGKLVEQMPEEYQKMFQQIQ